MILQEHKREAGAQKLRRKNYGDFYRVRKLEEAYEKALQADDVHNAAHFDYEIEKIFKRHKIAE